jgi:hypothetical protein
LGQNLGAQEGSKKEDEKTAEEVVGLGLVGLGLVFKSAHIQLEWHITECCALQIWD